MLSGNVLILQFYINSLKLKLKKQRKKDYSNKTKAMSHQSRGVRPSDLGENMVDVGVHKALLVSVLGHPQDLGGHCRDRWDGDVHVVPGGHGKQGGDVGIRAVETSGL